MADVRETGIVINGKYIRLLHTMQARGSAGVVRRRLAFGVVFLHLFVRVNKTENIMRYDLSSGTLRVRDIYRIGWDVVTRNGLFMLLLLALTSLPAALLTTLLNDHWGVVPSEGINFGYGLLSSMLSSLITMIASAAVMWLTAEDLREREVTGAKMLAVVGRCYVPLIIGYIGWMVMFMIGMALFVVPAIFVMVWYAFFPTFIVVEGNGVLDAFSNSYRLVKGNFFHVLGMSIALMLPVLVVLMIMEMAVTTPTTQFVVLVFEHTVMFYLYAMFTVFFMNVRKTWKLPEERQDAVVEAAPAEVPADAS